MRSIVLLLFLFHGLGSLPAQAVSVLDHGAKPDGRTICTRQIQSAIDAVHAQGKGTVVLPKGTFVTGSLVIRSGVTLHLEKGAVLLGSTEPADYIKLNRWKALILADGETDIAVTGKGRIDGRGRELALRIDSLFHAGRIDSADYNFVERRPKYYLRPQLIEFVRCQGIRIEDVSLQDAACWVLTCEQSRDIVIERVDIDSDAYWNNDGIDLQDCVDVRVSDCRINSSDDGICIKSHSYAHKSENIVVERCSVRSSASAIKFGTRSHGGFRNVTIRDIRVRDTYRSAVAIECVDGGILEDVLVERVKAVNTGNALFIRLGDRNRQDAVSVLRRVTIRDLDVKVAFERPDLKYDIRGPDLPFFHNVFPVSITGLPGHPVQGITLENVRIRHPGRGNPGLANLPLWRLDAVPEAAADYPEFSMFGELPAWGFYIRHAEDLVMKDVRLVLEASDYRPAFVLDDVRRCELTGRVLGDDKPYRVAMRQATGEWIDAGLKVLQVR